MWYRLRDRWPAGIGLLLAAGVLAGGVFVQALTPLVWGVAASLLVLFLLAQIWFDRRRAIQRERRLVHTSASLRLAGAQLERLASVDTLTGLPNRRAIFDQLGVEYRRAQRYQRDLAVLMIDIDNFKSVNDGSGHPFGDHVLAEVAFTLRGNLRESDHVGRYGGEEFLVLLPETDAEHAAAAAEKLRQAVEGHAIALPESRTPGLRTRVTVSIGAAALPVNEGEDENTLVRHADEALYEAKDAGKNRVHLHGRGVTSAGDPTPVRGG